MDVLVTGGTGYIGRNIVNELLKTAGVNRIIIFDRTIKCRWVSDKITYIKGDLCNNMDLIAAETFNLVYHEAANVDTTDTDEAKMIATNYTAFVNLIEICIEKGARLVYASSAAVYGNRQSPNIVGMNEEPLNVYGRSKLMMDNYVRENAATLPISVIGLRYFNVYGAGEEHKGSMKSMIGQMRNKFAFNTDIKLFEFGEQKRDFVYVGDIVKCNLLAGLSKEKRIGIYNCGSGSSVDFNTLYYTIKQHYPAATSSLTYIPNGFTFFQNNTCADIQPTNQDLNYTPAWDYVKGIADYDKIKFDFIRKYYIDFDNTLCRTEGMDYAHSQPILERIAYVNALKSQGHPIVIWTARGSVSKIDHRELTVLQLKEWGVNYDELLMGKPPYDIYIDDKSFNVDTYWPVPQTTCKSKKLASSVVPKGWGKEIVFVNNGEYCGKILCFDKGKKFSMHYHIEKKETWYVSKGKFLMHWINPSDGTLYSEYLNVGDVITNERGEPHQVMALEESELFEVSTHHCDEDSFRIWRGD